MSFARRAARRGERGGASAVSEVGDGAAASVEVVGAATIAGEAEAAAETADGGEGVPSAGAASQPATATRRAATLTHPACIGAS